MLIRNRLPDHGVPLDDADTALLGAAAVAEVGRYLSYRNARAATPVHRLAALAGQLDIGAIDIKDERQRLGLGSFKALGGAYAVMRLVLEAAERCLGRAVGIDALDAPEVRAIAARMTFACATDGNHGRSVAQGAQLVGARSAIFVHAGVSDARVAAIARFGAEIVRVPGSYDESVAEAARVGTAEGWTIVSDTAWPGYERIPGLVMQGYTIIAHEALQVLAEPPTHVFLQAGVGGFAAAVAAHLAARLGDRRPTVVVVEPARAACLFASAEAGRPVRVAQNAPTVMAMLDCCEPSPLAWRILSRIADAFMTVDEPAAIDVMNRLARPAGGDRAVVAGESGGVGLAGLIALAGDPASRAAIGLGANARVFVVNTEGATDPERYRELVGIDPGAVGRGR